MTTCRPAYRLVYNDSTHTYTLNGRRCKSVTAVAKIAPDSYALDQWRKRQVAIGMTLEPRLAERVAVDLDNRDAVDKICEDALVIAGAHHAANRGTQRHRASELSDLGGQLLTDQQRADAAAWQRTLEKHDIEIDPAYVEGFVLWPEHYVVGRYDRLARVSGKRRVVDLKSGENAVKYPQGTAVQLALYGRAPLISAAVEVQGDRSVVTEWAPPPADLDLSIGNVILLGDGMDIGELWDVDIEHGWIGAQHALNIVNWRKAYRYGSALAERVNPADTFAGTAIDDPVLAAITTAATIRDLDDVWSRHHRTWTAAHTAAARQRKAALTP